jgi:hypothetical protein
MTYFVTSLNTEAPRIFTKGLQKIGKYIRKAFNKFSTEKQLYEEFTYLLTYFMVQNII